MQRTPIIGGLLVGALLGWLGASLCPCPAEPEAKNPNQGSPSEPVTEQTPLPGNPDLVPVDSATSDSFEEEREEWRQREQALVNELDLAYQQYENAVLTMVPRSARDQLDSLLSEGSPDHSLQLSFGGDSTGKDAEGELVWFSAGKRGFFTVNGLGNLDPGHWTYQFWVTDDQRGEDVTISCGTFRVVAGRSNVFLLDPMVQVQRPMRAWVTVERAGGAVQSVNDRVALTSE